MEYWYRNTGGDELLFIHHGAGVLETPFGELAFRAHDYVVIPTGTTYRVLPASPTRMLVHESRGMVTIPRRYRISTIPKIAPMAASISRSKLMS